WPPRGHAGARAPPRGRPPLRRGPGDGARAPVAAGGPTGHGVARLDRLSAPPSPDARRPPMGTILFTGFPGFLGSRLIPRVLERAPDDRAVCLVQGRFAAQAEERLAALES